ncbi:glycoside hydrolase [Aspergillus campestris IBT 28561]|uniref:Probable beta-glucosidase btgE n=1 Tax=Aspergillus campestris (strain IBT 28561) TaxID=1392248 RepID=A0A2I1DB30_ASPC2|nr:glycoside hydrolase [Aspergillus campestris IBT 28561]PKY07082.1 glycoside hydrolase [Aspergillus campestris IBT 28561]
MKGAVFLATAAAVAGTALADLSHMKRHGHDSFHARRALHGAEGAEATCGCTTEVVTVEGPPTLIPISTPTPTPSPSPEPEPTTVTSEAVTTLHSTSYSTLTVTASLSTKAPTKAPSSSEAPAPPPTSTPVAEPTSAPSLPTPGVTSFSSTGVYTIPAQTVTVTDTHTVCGATSTELPSGTHTFGGVTTVVETATTVTCPYATVKPSGTTVTSVIETTTYVCPSGGTYTIAPTTTYVPSSTVMVYPTPATITPGTYTQTEQTVTATRTDFTYVCPWEDNLPTTAPAPSTTAPAVSTTAPASTTKVPSSTKSPTPEPTEPASGPMGMTYSPYSNDGGCKGKDEVSKDVSHIAEKGFTHLRVYSTDCSSLENIGAAAKENGMKLIIGVFIEGSGIEGAKEQVTDITSWAQWDLVTLIVVGNEAIQNGFCSATELASFIQSSKASFEKAGYSGDVTTTEPLNVWQENSEAMCGAVDVVGANIHPFFNAEVTPEQAGEFAAGQVKILEDLCGGKDVYNLETGWPSQGNSNGAAVPGSEQQAAAISALVKAVGKKSVFFSYSNDLWKDAGEFDVERYWGCIEQFK